MKYIKTFESFDDMVEIPETITLYHGTSKENAKFLAENGWSPRPNHVGANGGRGTLLYLTTGLEDAQWFSNEMGCDTVIKVSDVPVKYLRPDPEDEAGFTMVELFQRISENPSSPAKFGLLYPLSAEHFTIMFANI